MLGTKKIKYKGNTTNPKKRIWDEYTIEDEAGNVYENTLEVHEPKRITEFDKCEHEYEYADGGNSAICRKCGMGHSIVLGIHTIKDGKIQTKVIN